MIKFAKFHYQYFIRELQCDLVSQVNAPINKHQSGNGYTSLRARKMALRRKRSLSVADLPVPKDQEAPPSAVPSSTGGKKKGSRSFGPEESGYDSDTTRKSSPRGSLKNALAGSNSSSGGIGGSSDSGGGSARTSEEGSSGHSDEGSCGGKDITPDDSLSSSGSCSEENRAQLADTPASSKKVRQNLVPLISLLLNNVITTSHC